MRFLQKAFEQAAVQAAPNPQRRVVVRSPPRRRGGGLGALAGVVGATAVIVQAAAFDWPHWRGPDSNGVSRETEWSDRWPADGPRVLWKAKIGIGFSSVSAANGRVFTLGNQDNADTVFCFEAETGKPIWKHRYDADLGDKFFEGGSTGTPTVDGDAVYTLSRWGDAFCFEASTGKVRWSKNVQKEFDARVPGWGFGGSPFVYQNAVIFNVGESGLALDKATGATLWHSANQEAGYSTPIPIQDEGKTLCVIGNGKAYVAVDPLTGKESWKIRWLTEYGVNAADPIFSAGHLFLSTGYGKGAALFKLGGAAPAQIWKSKVLRTQMNPAVLIDGFLYGVDGDTTDKAAFKCVELMTGAEKWTEAGIGSGSISAAGGKLIVLSDHGELLTAPATPAGFKPTARAQVLGGKCWTVPVLANGRIYCRNARGDLTALDVRSK